MGMVDNFLDNTHLVAKMDIEGGEFPILNALLDMGKAHVFDTLALECHPFAGNCTALFERLRSESNITFIREKGTCGLGSLATGSEDGYDSLSTPELFFPEKP